MRGVPAPSWEGGSIAAPVPSPASAESTIETDSRPRCFRSQRFGAEPRPKSLRALWKPEQETSALLHHRPELGRYASPIRPEPLHQRFGAGRRPKGDFGSPLGTPSTSDFGAGPRARGGRAAGVRKVSEGKDHAWQRKRNQTAPDHTQGAF